MFPFVMNAQVLERSLNAIHWKFRKKEDKLWSPAMVPGTVHTDLLANDLIPDPFYGNNEAQLQWIENADWEYKASFNISKKELAQSHIELQFDGLDTYAKVYVNDSLILTADNMFRSWNVDVKKYVHKGTNKLYILFESAVRKGEEEAKKLTYTLPGDEKVFTRKAQYQYGWDWGPCFVTCGIWKDVKLVFWNYAKLENVKCIQKSITDKQAELEFVCEIKCDSAGVYRLGGTQFLIGKPGLGAVKLTYNDVSLKKGMNTISFFHVITNPRKWWCNGLGEAVLYPIALKLYRDQSEMDEKELNVGLRTIELIQDKDSIGRSFYFKLNGVPVFMKGANFIPPDNFLPRVKTEKYDSIVLNAVNSNMNMLRVWGGGVYANDAFYDACDKNGILVWQDFMFACAMYPDDDHFINNVAEEIIDQTKRLRNHPSIALWCGNNEVDEGWKNWEWQKQYHYSEKDSTTIALNNYALFDNLIKNLVNTYDGSRAYWPSSPSIGWGHKESLQEGDSHYWGVWWGMEPFEMYKSKVGRFVSEYGFQGMASLSSLAKMGVYNNSYSYDLDLSFRRMPLIDTLALDAHQKHPTGYKTINTYLQRDYKIPNGFENYVYVSQLLQAEGMKTAIEAHRRAKPYCMGTLYWQLNDCWPVTSWSSIDYYSNWKASQYQVKRSYSDMLISVEEKETTCDVYVISDLMKSEQNQLFVELFDFNGKLLWSTQLIVTMDANSSKMIYQFDKALIKKYASNELVLKCSFVGISEWSTLHYFEKPKDLDLKKPTIKITQLTGNSIEISTDVLAKDVMLSYRLNSLVFSDNYFDLIPNQNKIIYFKGKLAENEMHEPGDKIFIQTKSLFDSY